MRASMRQRCGEPITIIVTAPMPAAPGKNFGGRKLIGARLIARSREHPTAMRAPQLGEARQDPMISERDPAGAYWFNPSIAHQCITSSEAVLEPRNWLRDLDMT
jgi:hypothetical protein